jgi:ABC-2 type transport system permease protein
MIFFKNRWLHLNRIGVITINTFTQLARMKVFYFLGIFSMVAIAVNFLNLPQFSGPESVGAGELQILKSSCMGVMKLFSIVFAICATALLLPKDAEDRTLYTILAKPVPRFDYLFGKLCGVLLLIFVSLLLMDLLMSAVLMFRTDRLMGVLISEGESRGWTGEAQQSLRNEISVQGVTWSQQASVLIVFFEAMVMAALALLLSTFSTSTLFTIIVSFLIYLIGHFQSDAADFYRATSEAGMTTMASFLSKLLSLLVPNFQLFNVVNGTIEGVSLSLANVGMLGLVALFHLFIYTLLSWYVFSDKEF